MFNKINKKWASCMAILFALAFASCKKDGQMITATAGTAPGFSMDSTSLHFSSGDSANHAISFNWSPSDFGAQVAVTYDLLLSTDSTFTTNVLDQSFGGVSTGITYTVAQFNSLALGAGGKPEQQDTIYARIKCSMVVQNSAPNNTYQNSPTYMIIVNSPYVLTIPSIWVPGDYQGWSPGGAGCAQLYSPGFNKQYEGYVMIPSGGTYQFKITPAANWDVSYGSADGNTNGGSLSTSGGNLQVSGPGYWLITADLGGLTWTATLNNWTIIGTVNNTNWDTDIPFSFDVTNQVLTATINCNAGDQFKFRANADWTLNIGGDYDAATGKVSNIAVNGDNITIPTAGTYIVTLNLQIPSQPACTVIKQ
ncbi:MAG: SusE domain-containing protein [Chitinophagaceae bacterium]|jgi:hypothetical protein|nr:SusE domain-containing protein [Chitinophagaceae bacterium]